jgi:drug/metabolite transporter (DMT)-like permease
MYKKYIGPASLLLIGVLFGLSGVIAKYLSVWLDPYQVVEYRFLIAFIIAVFVLLTTKQKLSFNKIDRKTLLAFAITFPISVIFFTLAIFNTTVSLAVFSFYIATLVSSFVVGKIYFKEEINTNKKIALFFILIAVILFTDPFNGFSLESGFLFGLISGVFQTIASAFQKIVGQSTNRISLLIIQTLAGTGISALAIYMTGGLFFPAIPQSGMLVALFFGAIFLVISYLFLVGFKYTNLNVGSILVSSELFFGPFFAFLLLSEKLTNLELLGGLSIAIAVIFSNKE